LPLFFSQAGAGGPLTVTDKAATRYFISEREAVHEILKSSIHPARGALVIPRTHDPINIHEMAQAIATKWGLPEGSVATGRPRQGDCRHELLTASGEEWSFDRHERQNVALPCPGPRFLEDVLTTTKEARRHNDNWAKERLAELLNANDSLQDKTTIASGDVGDQEALHCS
jgi:FlaA1/EpsC-like NDP-sugar epimerase